MADFHPRATRLIPRSRLANTSMQDKKTIAANIESQARYARALVIWTDCDLEGEHIGSEIRNAARRGNGQIEIKRARFSNIERAWVAVPVDLLCRPWWT